MKTLNLNFTDSEFQKLKKAKRIACEKTGLSWEKFIILNCTKGVSVKREFK
jgi:hypothetical protein